MMKNLVVLIFGVCLCVLLVQGSPVEPGSEETGNQLDTSNHDGHEIKRRKAVLLVRYPCQDPSDHTQCERVCRATGKTGGQCRDQNTCLCRANVP